MPALLSQILPFIFVIGIVVVVHEFGHYIAARSVGIRVERFSVGFPPRMIGKKIGDTDYCISWVPLGGYVKMAGMIDESMENPEKITGAPDEFMSKNFLQKSWVISAGVILNFLLAWVIYSATIIAKGNPIPSDEAFVTMVSEDQPAGQAGLEPGDKLLSIDGVDIASWDSAVEKIHGSAGVPIDLVWEREGERMEATLTPAPKEQADGTEIGLIGIQGTPGIKGYEPVGVGEGMAAGWRQTEWVLSTVVDSIKKLVTGGASVKDLGGPIVIAKWSAEVAEQGFVALLRFVAFISINIGFLNILPIPVLDGGHLVFILLEAVARRPIPTKIKLAIQQVGMIGLLIFMAFVLWNDAANHTGLLSRVIGLFSKS